MNVVSIPNKVLFTKAEPVTTLTPKITRLIKDMTTTLAKAQNPKGIGLAAPQVGISLRLFIIRLKPKSPRYVFINPEVVSVSDAVEEKPDLLEGCLSIPAIWGPVKRHSTVILRFMDETGKTEEKSFSGLMATAIQHEMDHLVGVLFTARVIEQGKKLYQMEHDKEGKVVFTEIKL